MEWQAISEEINAIAERVERLRTCPVLERKGILKELKQRVVAFGEAHRDLLMNLPEDNLAVFAALKKSLDEEDSS